MKRKELVKEIASASIESEVDPKIISVAKIELIKYISGFYDDTIFDDNYFYDCVERLMPKGSWLYNLNTDELNIVEVEVCAFTDIYLSVRRCFDDDIDSISKSDSSNMLDDNRV